MSSHIGLIVLGLTAVALELAGASAAAQPPTAQSCRQQRAAMESRAKQLAAERKFWRAHLELYECARVLGDVDLRALSRSYEIADYEATLKDPNASTDQRRKAMDRLLDIAPERARKVDPYGAELAAKLAAEEKQAAQREAARRRKEGVRIGMSKTDVLASSWGRPQHINRTVTAHGMREQWVYDLDNYLYFEGNTLVAVQTGH